MTTQPGAWQYVPSHTSRRTVAAALLISAGLHAGVLLGIRHHTTPRRTAEPDTLIALQLSMPSLKELEEPEPTPNADDSKPDLTTLVPMQQDVPQIARPNDFVQVLDFSSLLPRPDYNAATVFNIPENINRSAKIGEGLVVFNIADLDRVPEAIVQPAPIFPPALKREVEFATVRVEFIVDTEGRVLNPVVIESSHPGFNEAATAGVNRWKFRAGFKNGRKVNTRMLVPIVFRLVINDV